MPSSRLNSHRNSMQNGMVEKFTAFMATIFVPNFRFYVTATFCRPRFPNTSSQKLSRRNSVQNAPISIFTALTGTIFVTISVFVSRGNFHATSEQLSRNFRATFKQLPGNFRATSGQLPGNFRATSGQLSGNFRATFGQLSGNFRTTFGQLLGNLCCLRIKASTPCLSLRNGLVSTHIS